MNAAQNFNRFRDHLFGWPVECLEGNDLSLRRGEPYTLKFKRPHNVQVYKQEPPTGIQVEREFDEYLDRDGRKVKSLLFITLRFPGREI